MTAADILPVTREEWERRQASGPAWLRALLEQAREQEDAYRRELRRTEEANARWLADRRTDFEATVSALLASEGGEWLADYRRPDAEWAGAHTMTQDSTRWAALFVPAAVGLHPIRVDLFSPENSDVWVTAACPFTVELPGGRQQFRTLADAVLAAATFVTVPF